MPIGLYLHVPFCVSKCPYCDFYSLVATNDALDAYTAALCTAIHRWGERVHDTADTVYLGGGTPSLLGPERLSRVLNAVHRAFAVPDTAEITLEANPADDLQAVLSAFVAAGGNRLSLGMQAVRDDHLHTLGRRHSVAQAEHAIATAHAVGITNVSLDLMLGTPQQTAADVRAGADRCAAWGASHVSAYLLKLEPNTPFGSAPPPLPDEDVTAELYLTAAEALESHGYRHYEISNFALPGRESRHNTKYWNLDPYLGIGPSAHSFYGGTRFAYPRDLAAFLNGCDPTPENPDHVGVAENSPEEYALLRLRLAEGLREDAFTARFGTALPAAWRERAAALPPTLVVCDEHGIRLTRDGFLVSNAVLAHLLS